MSIKDPIEKILITEEEIKKRVKELAKEIDRDYEGKEPLIVSVLSGSYMFTADIMREISLPLSVNFIYASSYGTGTSSTGKVTEVIGINKDLTGRCIVIIEDIVESGLTMQRLLEILAAHNPSEIHIASLLVKPEMLKVPLNIEYVAMNIPNDFIVGYGLDYDQLGRNLKDIYTVVE